MLINIISTIFSGGRVDLISVIMQIAAVLFIIFCILPLHEYAHAFVAYKLGDHTAKFSGRLTLNPLASIEPLGAIFILLFGFGWAKPVPIDTRYFKNRKRDTALVALAGPVSNILAALFGAIVLNLVALIFIAVPSFLYVFLYYYIIINVSLAAFNLLPVPPLDGSKILEAFLPDSFFYKYYRYQRYFILIIFFLLFTGILNVPLNLMRNGLFRLIMFLAELPFKIFSLF